MPPELPDLKMGFRDINFLGMLPYYCNAVGINAMVLIDIVFVPEPALSPNRIPDGCSH